MTYRLAAGRRSRRRRILASLVPIAIAVAIVALAVRHRTEERETTDYLAVAADLADRELGVATTLGDLLASIGDLERPDILRTLEALAETSERLRADLETATVPRPAARLGGLFTVAVDSWSDALVSLDDAFIAVLDLEEGDESGDLLLARAFENLRVGDAAYRRFLESVVELDAELVTREFPQVAFASGSREPLFDAALIAERLRLIRKFAEMHDVAITANTTPEPISDSNGVLVLPVAESYDVMAVVTNQGNVGEELIVISLLLDAPTSETVEPIDLSVVIPFLEPGEARTVPFQGVTLDAGLVYRLRLSVAVSDDADDDDNVFELTFFTNEA